jgi:hypothetical protein
LIRQRIVCAAKRDGAILADNDCAVGIRAEVPLVEIIKRVDLRERQENRRRRHESDKTAVHLLDSHAVKPPSPLNPSNAMTNFANR